MLLKEANKHVQSEKSKQNQLNALAKKENQGVWVFSFWGFPRKLISIYLLY